MTDTTMIDRLKQFVESEMRSCSMDIGGITPLYVYRMWGGSVAMEDEDARGTGEIVVHGSWFFDERSDRSTFGRLQGKKGDDMVNTTFSIIE